MNFNRMGTLMVLPIAIFADNAKSALLLQEITLHTMLESTVSVLTTLGDYAVLNPDGITNGTAKIGAGGIAWTGSYSDSAWTYAGAGIFGGAALSMTYSGLLTGADGSNISVSIAGTGFLGSQPLLMNGSTTWTYDSATDDYLTMEFAQETKIGAASRWGWVRGREPVYCVKGGVVRRVIAGNDIGVSPVDSSATPAVVGRGMRKCFPVDAAGEILVAVASSGKQGTMAVSATRKTALQESQHVAPGLPPPLSDLFSPDNQGTLVADDGGLYADDMFNRYRSTGRYTADTFAGITINVVPEPATAWMVLIGMMGLWGAQRRKSNLQGRPGAGPLHRRQV